MTPVQLLLLASCCAASPPHIWPGHTIYGDGNSRITLDVFGDYQCPDTAKAWPTLLNDLPKLVNASELRIRYHLTEILHHDNAYKAAVAAYITTQLMDAQHGLNAFTAVSTGLFYNAPTANITRLQVREILYGITGAPLKIDHSKWNTAFEGDDAEHAVSVEHGYAVSKGIAGTPTFWVQDQSAPEPTESWTADDWVAYLAKI
jgi:protein-disulfide isomerase